MKTPIFIAEIKTKSLYGFESKHPRNLLIDTALKYGDWISIHTDPRFGGSFDDIHMIRERTKKPILAKGFHCHDDDVKKAFDLGADYVLCVDRIPMIKNGYYKKPDNLIIELSDLKNTNINLAFIKDSGYKVAFNARDIRTGFGRNFPIPTYEKYRKQFKWLCGASLLREPRHVELIYPNCDAFIVGENLVEFCDKLV